MIISFWSPPFCKIVYNYFLNLQNSSLFSSVILIVNSLATFSYFILSLLWLELKTNLMEEIFIAHKDLYFLLVILWTINLLSTLPHHFLNLGCFYIAKIEFICSFFVPFCKHFRLAMKSWIKILWPLNFWRRVLFPKNLLNPLYHILNFLQAKTSICIE